jgi:hypothetical protein
MKKSRPPYLPPRWPAQCDKNNFFMREWLCARLAERDKDTIPAALGFRGEDKQEEILAWDALESAERGDFGNFRELVIETLTTRFGKRFGDRARTFDIKLAPGALGIVLWRKLLKLRKKCFARSARLEGVRLSILGSFLAPHPIG